METKHANVILVFENGETLLFDDMEYINRRKLIDKITFMAGDKRLSSVTDIIIQPLTSIKN